MEHALIGQTEATARWKVARIRLSEAIQEFNAMTSIFTRVLFGPTSSSEIEFDIESTLESLDLELEQLASDGDILGAARTRIKVARNASKRVVPISRLPLGVLSDIFHTVIAWADDCCDRNGVPCESHESSDLGWKTRTVSLTGVCATWRRIIVETPSYWSHIDVRFATRTNGWTYIPTEYSKLCLQRANKTPLKLHVYFIEEDEQREASSTGPFPECFHGQTISSISFELNWAEEENANPIIRAWKDLTLTSAVTCLKIKNPCGFEVEELPISHMCEQLHTLELGHIITDWNRIRFPGLVNLTLDGNDRLPMDQLRDILVASPALCTLVINGKNADENDLVQFEGAPVELGRLVSLGLGRASAFDVILLLRMIRPAPECTAVAISYARYESSFKNPDRTSYNRMWEATQTFCTQHKVSHLSLNIPLSSNSTRLRLAHLLHSLTNLHTLALRDVHLDIVDSDIPQLGGSIDIFFEYMTPPTLQRLYLINTYILAVGLQSMVSASSIRWLRMDRCVVKDHSQDLFEWLERSVPELHLHHTGDSVCNVVCSSDFELPRWISCEM